MEAWDSRIFVRVSGGEGELWELTGNGGKGG